MLNWRWFRRSAAATIDSCQSGLHSAWFVFKRVKRSEVACRSVWFRHKASVTRKQGLPRQAYAQRRPSQAMITVHCCSSQRSRLSDESATGPGDYGERPPLCQHVDRFCLCRVRDRQICQSHRHIYLSMKYTERLADAGIGPSVGRVKPRSATSSCRLNIGDVPSARITGAGRQGAQAPQGWRDARRSRWFGRVCDEFLAPRVDFAAIMLE